MAPAVNNIYTMTTIEENEMVDSGKKKNIFDRLLIAIRPKKEPADIVEYADRIIRDATGGRADPIGKAKGGYMSPVVVLSIPILAIIGIIYGTLKIFL